MKNTTQALLLHSFFYYLFSFLFNQVNFLNHFALQNILHLYFKFITKEFAYLKIS